MLFVSSDTRIILLSSCFEFCLTIAVTMSQLEGNHPNSLSLIAPMHYFNIVFADLAALIRLSAGG
jgi:hypothetical protein